MAEFYYRFGPNEFGPLAADELRQMARDGRAVPAGEVRRGKAGPWVTADRVQGLFVSGSAPPIGREPLTSAAPASPPVFESIPEPEAEFDSPEHNEPSELSELGAIVDTEMTEETFAGPSSVHTLGTHRFAVLRRIAQAFRVLGGLCVLLALLGAAPVWIQAQYRLDSSLAGALAALFLVGGLVVVAVILFAMGESIKLLIDIEQNTRQLHELLSQRSPERRVSSSDDEESRP